MCRTVTLALLVSVAATLLGSYAFDAGAEVGVFIAVSVLILIWVPVYEELMKRIDDRDVERYHIIKLDTAQYILFGGKVSKEKPEEYLTLGLAIDAFDMKYWNPNVRQHLGIEVTSSERG